MLLTLLLAAMSPTGIESAVQHAPLDLRAFIERRRGCNHWAGEEPYDRDRQRQIASAVRHLRCRDLERDEHALRRIYRGRADLVRLLDATADGVE